MSVFKITKIYVKILQKADLADILKFWLALKQYWYTSWYRNGKAFLKNTIPNHCTSEQIKCLRLEQDFRDSARSPVSVTTLPLFILCREQRRVCFIMMCERFLECYYIIVEWDFLKVLIPNCSRNSCQIWLEALNKWCFGVKDL